MSLYEVIQEWLYSLFPTNLTNDMMAYVNLVSYIILSLLIYVLIIFTIWLFKKVSGLFIW